MKKMIICGVVLGAVVVLSAGARDDMMPQDQTAQQIADLNLTIAQMGLRIDQLEHASGGSSHSSHGGGSAATPARTMVLSSVSQSGHTDNHSEEIGQLKRQHASLMNTVNGYADQMGEDAGQDVYVQGSAIGARGWGVGGGSASVSTNVGAIGRQVVADRALMNRYATLGAIKKRKLEALQNADAVPKQILLGHDAKKTIFTLDTKVDLSESLNSIAIGDTVTWTGTRLSAGDGSETWRITSIKKAN